MVSHVNVNSDVLVGFDCHRECVHARCDTKEEVETRDNDAGKTKAVKRGASSIGTWM